MKKRKQKSFLHIGKGSLRAAAALILVLTITAFMTACGDSGQSGNDSGKPNSGVSATEISSSAAPTDAAPTVSPTEAAVNVVPTAASSIKLVDWETEAFTMQIPDGWKTHYGWDGEKMLLIRVYDPANPINQIFYATDMVPFIKSKEAGEIYARSGLINMSEATVLDPPTNENLFKQMPKIRTYYTDTANLEAAANMIPEIYNFQMLESMPAGSKDPGIDDNLIYGTFRNADASAEGEGIGFASIVDHFEEIPNMIDGVDVSFYNVYSLTALTAAKDELVNYEEVLCKSFSSLKIKQEFIDKMLKNSDESFAQFQQINASISAAYDSYNAAWMARSQSSDISRQKQSDATLGYERVYDTETGEVYKAYRGFTDDYTGTRYQPITDDMYSKGWSGYIEK